MTSPWRGTRFKGSGDLHGWRTVAILVVALAGLPIVPVASAVGPLPPFTFVRMIPSASTNLYLSEPKGIDVDPAGNVWVADSLNSRVVKLNGSGLIASSIGSDGTGPGQFRGSPDVAIGATGTVFVLDRVNARVQRFSSNGQFEKAWGSFGSGDGHFRYPRGLALAASGEVVVADTGNNRVQAFSATGSLIATVATPPGGTALSAPEGVFVDSLGVAWVADTGNNRVVALFPFPNYAASIGATGTGDGQFVKPSDVAVDASRTAIYVVDTNNHRVQKFKWSDFSFVTKWGYRTSAPVGLTFPSGIDVDASGNVWVTDLFGDRVKKYTADGTQTAVFAAHGTADGKLFWPYGVDVDAAGNIYVVESENNRISKFGPTGSFITKWGTQGSGDAQLNLPHDILVDAAGDMFVLDSANARIQKFSSAGGFITKWGSGGNGDGQFSMPRAFTRDNAGNIYVADTWNNRIQKFSSTGQFLSKWSDCGDHQLDDPGGIVWDPAGYIYVADSINQHIDKFSISGTWLGKYGAYGAGPEPGYFMSPERLAVDEGGNLYISDRGNTRIQVMSPGGSFINAFGGAGSLEGDFDYPYGLAFGPDGDLYVADSGHHRIQQFHPPDMIAPLTSANVLSSYTAVAGITLTGYDNTGGSGVASVYYRLDGGPQKTGPGVTTSIVGHHTLEFWSEDASGNVETPHRFAAFDVAAALPPPPPADTTPPTTVTDAAASYEGTATITFLGTDNAGGSGVAHTYYSLDGAAQVEGTVVTVSSPGPHVIQFWSVDGSGNVETPHPGAAFVIAAPPPPLDTTSPTTVSTAEASYTATATIVFSASDTGGTGVSSTHYRLDGGADTVGNYVVVSSEGTHTLEWWSFDNAGNEEDHRTQTFVIKFPAPPGKTPTAVSIATSATSAKIGGRFILSGLVTPNAPAMIGKWVHADVKKPGKSYWSYSSNRVVYAGPGGKASWWYRYVLKPGMAKGTYIFRCVFDGNTTHARSMSGMVRIAVK